MMDIDIPSLTVEINSRFLNQRVNTDDFVKFKIILDSGIYPETVRYSAAITYKFEIIATREFDFLEFRFKIQVIIQFFNKILNFLLIFLNFYIFDLISICGIKKSKLISVIFKVFLVFYEIIEIFQNF